MHEIIEAVNMDSVISYLRDIVFKKLQQDVA